MEAGENKGKGKKEKEQEVSGTSAETPRRIFRRFFFFLFPFAFLLAGCATGQSQVDRALMADPGSPARGENVANSYAVGCPDVLEIVVAGRPDLTGLREIGPDGRVALGHIGRVRIEGQTLPEVTRRLAEAAEVPPQSVRASVAEYRGQQVYLIGQIVGLQRAIPYRGPETVLDLLRRAGGLTPGAAPDNVFVVRSRVAEGKTPEVFRVDLQAILFRHDTRTNIRLQPLDQVFVGETKQSCFEKCVPPWLRPVYDALWGIRRTAGEERDKVTR
jgi:protein involved in polysaccharide export with SLBB domain